MHGYTRDRALARYDRLYRLVGSPIGCAYCGSRHQCIDHIISLRYVWDHPSAAGRFHLVKVPSCLDCNSRAFYKLDADFPARRERIAVSLASAKFVLLNLCIATPSLERQAVMARLRVLRSDELPLGMPTTFDQNKGAGKGFAPPSPAA